MITTEYLIELEKIGITQTILMSTAPLLSKVRNKKNRTKFDEEILNFLLEIRKPIEEANQKAREQFDKIK